MWDADRTAWRCSSDVAVCAVYNKQQWYLFSDLSCCQNFWFEHTNRIYWISVFKLLYGIIKVKAKRFLGSIPNAVYNELFFPQMLLCIPDFNLHTGISNIKKIPDYIKKFCAKNETKSLKVWGCLQSFVWSQIWRKMKLILFSDP